MTALARRRIPALLAGAALVITGACGSGQAEDTPQVVQFETLSLSDESRIVTVGERLLLTRSGLENTFTVGDDCVETLCATTVPRMSEVISDEMSTLVVGDEIRWAPNDVISEHGPDRGVDIRDVPGFEASWDHYTLAAGHIWRVEQGGEIVRSIAVDDLDELDPQSIPVREHRLDGHDPEERFRWFAEGDRSLWIYQYGQIWNIDAASGEVSGPHAIDVAGNANSRIALDDALLATRTETSGIARITPDGSVTAVAETGHYTLHLVDGEAWASRVEGAVPTVSPIDGEELGEATALQIPDGHSVERIFATNGFFVETSGPEEARALVVYDRDSLAVSQVIDLDAEDGRRSLDASWLGDDLAVLYVFAPPGDEDDTSTEDEPGSNRIEVYRGSPDGD